MSPIYEKVKTEIDKLPDDEQYGLYAALRERFEPEIQEAATGVALDSAWAMELDTRVMELANGSANLIPGPEVDREIDALFARRGGTRLPRAA